jgi:hypothetical protein
MFVYAHACIQMVMCMWINVVYVRVVEAWANIHIYTHTHAHTHTHTHIYIGTSKLWQYQNWHACGVCVRMCFCTCILQSVLVLPEFAWHLYMYVCMHACGVCVCVCVSLWTCMRRFRTCTYVCACMYVILTKQNTEYNIHTCAHDTHRRYIVHAQPTYMRTSMRAVLRTYAYVCMCVCM